MNVVFFYYINQNINIYYLYIIKKPFLFSIGYIKVNNKKKKLKKNLKVL